MNNITVIFHKQTGKNYTELIIGPSNVYLWYIGPNGLKTDGAIYYKKMIKKLLSKSNVEKISLVDLTAWASFFDTNKCAKICHQSVQTINTYHWKIQCVPTSSFFVWLTNITQQPMVNFLNELIDKPNIYTISEKFNQSNIILSSVIQTKDETLLKNIMTKDTSKVYSAVQYIEVFYLIMKSIEQKMFNIYFLLPNNECEYYNNEHFRSDITTFVQLMDITNTEINIEFVPFKYSSNIKARPYNSGGELVTDIDRSLIC